MAVLHPIRTLSAKRLQPLTAEAPPDLSAAIARLKRRAGDRIAAHWQIPAVPARYAAMPGLHPGLVGALKQRGIDELYSHQREAFDAVKAGEHVVVLTPTASGKTLCYNLPVIDAVLNRRCKALYLFPTKALAQDQVSELLELNKAGDLKVKAFTFDGDTPSDARKAVRTEADIVVSNPDMLHQAILPHHTKWAQFFENLQYIVIDEVHTYRGVFGAHVANLLRRLQRVLAFYGAKPQFILCSATIANPKQHAEALIGAPVQAITESGAPRGARQVLFWNPPVINPDLGIRAPAQSESQTIAKQLIESGFKTLVFANSRLLVEVITKYLKDEFDHDPRRKPRIRAYRGGYLPTERREIERAMRAGEIDGLVSTSALELGVDIGALDATVLNAYPGSIAASWQRIGRAGRRQQESLAVLVAGSEALDQYLMRKPEYFQNASPEQARIAPNQALILLDHIRCAAFELPFQQGDRFGDQDTGPYLQVLSECGVLHQEGQQYHWINEDYPAQAVNLRAVADGNFVVVDITDGRQLIIAEVDFTGAAMTLYEGAIYMVQSEPFQVERLDWAGRKAFVRRTTVDYYTDAIDYSKLKVLDVFADKAAGQGRCAQGEVHVIRRVTGYKKIRYYTHENIGYGPINLPDQEMHTSAVWWRLPAALLQSVFRSREQALDGFLSAAFAARIVATFRLMAESRDLARAVGHKDGASASGLHLKLDANDEQFAPTLYLYDNYVGGIGLTEPLYDLAASVIQETRSMIQACACPSGCPACVGPVASVSEQQTPTRKDLALTVLRLLQDAA
ncbi:helicase [Ahniella affigens]|uniref:Helicase n=1 Tax=Ahniella affigens TaxID=2021234 RepID=A0A2P1PXQ4_9GAMM|nr:DEAD/DEAH box helicase [Ahniella affigens]AVP99627.1 helicase [Ahniella affigens]